jgi:phosphopantothenoylcysteine decarboxylase/phosphopantothenate--cysteine ligase
MDFACLTAAVCDFRPQDRHQEKFKKSEAVSGLNIHFANNPDILSALGRHKAPGQCLIGFAAETSAELETLSKDKLRSKGLDLILANRVDRPGLGFGSRTNQVLVLDTKGRQQSWPCLDKGDIAWRIWDWILGM